MYIEQKIGSSWCRNKKDRKFFNRRNVYYNKIQSLSKAHQKTLDAAANQLEERRINENLSLNALLEKLIDERKVKKEKFFNAYPMIKYKVK
jgi:Transcriptional activator of glycolytic enzymes